jgi:hypothetical protein
MGQIKGALEVYRQAIELFEETADQDGDHSAKDYEYRDDDAIRFAAEAEPVIAKVIELADRARLTIEDCRRSAEPDLDVGMSEVFEARSNAEELLAELVALVDGPAPTIEDI